jgi:hypothetical protein
MSKSEKPEIHPGPQSEDDVLKRLLAMPPQPKTKKTDEGNLPKKRGRPKKEQPDS